MNIGIIGTGTIATYLLEQVNENRQVNGQITAVFGRNQEVGSQLSQRFGVEFFTEMKEFLALPLDIVVEASTVEAARLYCQEVVESGKELVVASIGVFKELEFLEKLKRIAETTHAQVYLPSGAIGGLDLVQSANATNGLTHVQITTRKSPASLGLEANHPEEVIFKGSAREAIERFPKNVNVALVLSLAGIGMDKTRVCVLVDPARTQNTHTIDVEGGFGKMTLQVDNNPMVANPKTSLLAALSILNVLQNTSGAVTIGN